MTPKLARYSMESWCWRTVKRNFRGVSPLNQMDSRKTFYGLESNKIALKFLWTKEAHSVRKQSTQFLENSFLWTKWIQKFCVDWNPTKFLWTKGTLIPYLFLQHTFHCCFRIGFPLFNFWSYMNKNIFFSCNKCICSYGNLSPSSQMYQQQ